MCERKNTNVWLVVFGFFALLVTGPIAAGKIIHVDAHAAGANDGSSWENAYTFLQNALADANSAEKPVEIRVAQGIYRPNEGIMAIPEFDWRTTTFQLINGVIIKGGYPSVTEPDPNEKDVELYETILSGDLNGDDAEVADPCDLLDEPTRAENSYHVLSGNLTDETAVLDGFTITGGNANDEDQDHFEGGGLYNERGSPTLIKCTFTKNTAYGGGGMANWDDSGPTLIQCTFSGNWADSGGGVSNGFFSSPTLTHCTFSGNSAGHGAGIFNSNSNPTLTNCVFHGNSANNGGAICNSDSSPILSDCKFAENSAEIGGGMANGPESDPILTNCTFSTNSAGCGGGISNWMANPKLINCTFTGNSAELGGGMESFESYPTVTNCIFSGNSADEDGGGIYNCWDSNPTLTNCTFTGNKANSGGGICSLGANSTLANCTFSGNKGRYAGAICTISAGATVTDSILWDNTSRQIFGNAVVSHSDVQGGFPGEGNIDVDPLFANPGYWDPNGTPDDPNDDFWIDGDYHLQSETGRWDPDGQSWVTDGVTSPSIDAGDTASDCTGELWPHGKRMNMGAFGGTPQASMSLSDVGNIADLNIDDIVDLQDFANLAHCWQMEQALLSEDLDRDGTVGLSDVAIFVEHWLEVTAVPAVEDFETADFSKFEWEHAGNASWAVTPQQKHSGAYSAKAGSIDHDQSTTVQVSLDCGPGNITFYRKVSSEAGRDTLMFYIDGVERGIWSGEEDWAEVSFGVTEGMRTFRWVYSKSRSGSKGDDTAWIDDIVFPAQPNPTPPTAEIELTDATFDQVVLSSDVPVLVDFWAPWCGPCLTMAPIIKEIADEYAGKAKVCKLNVDNAPNTTAAYGISAIPTFILFKDGQIQRKWIGTTSKEVLADAIDQLL